MRKPKKMMVLVLAGIAAGSLLEQAILDAQSSSSTLRITASVSRNCAISTTPVNFGAYDPVAANATAPLDSTGSLTVACTKGTIAKVGLNDGSYSQGSTRRMRLSATAYLNYQIYKDTSRTTVWGEGLVDSLYLPPAPNRNPRTFTAYGRVVGGQDASTGTYADTVLATIDF